MNNLTLDQAQEQYDRQLPKDDILCDECGCTLSEWEVDHKYSTCNECSEDCRCRQCI